MSGARGDAQFADFMSGEQRALLRFAMALTGEPRLADEIVGNAFGKAYERWPRIAGLDRPDAYLRRMVVNEFLSHKRRARRLVELSPEHGGPVPDPAGQHADREEVKARLRTLPKRQRVAIVLRYYEGCTDAEIAAVLDCAVGTVRSLISRALATMRIRAVGERATQRRQSLAVGREACR